MKENIFKRAWNGFVGFFKNANTDNLYNLNGCVPVHKAALFGLQHILAMFIANIAPILVTIAAISSVDGAFTGIDQTSVIQNAIFIAGIGTIIQLYPVWRFGGRLPIVVGVSFTFVGMLIYVGQAYGYGTMVGSLIVGGLFITLMGIFAKYWKKFIKPIVSSSVVLAIGLSLLKVGGDYFASTAGTICTPEITEHYFSQDDKFIILASDGLFEFIDSDEVVSIVKDYYLGNDIVACCEFLYKESCRRWIQEEEDTIDDITIIVVFFE